MKKIIYLITLFYSTCILAQTPVLNLHSPGVYPFVENAYYKDIDGFYDQFVGTWIYTDSHKTIRFKFKKKEMFYYQSTKNYYEDFLIGEMQYIENGVQKINSIINLSEDFNSIFDYSLYSYGKVTKNWYPKCMECPDTIERLNMSYNEPTNNDIGLEAAFVMHRADENGVQKIRVNYILTNGPNGRQPDWVTPSTTTDFLIPYGNYTLIKQN